MPLRLITLTILTLVAFAANSVFARLALVDPANDPISFTLVRLFAGAVVLFYVFVRSGKSDPIVFSLKSLVLPLMLFSYAIFFSLAYVMIDTGTGALILFASVQLTMVLVAICRGLRLNIIEWCGFLLAFSGLIYLLFPGLTAPPLAASILMALSGLSWGVYSLVGQGASNPILLTARNFVFLIPIVFILALIFPLTLTDQGYLWAILSGALTSGLGYVLWYIILKHLLTSTAAILQLSVPAIAAFGGVMFLNETITLRLVIATAIIFTGISIKIRGSKNQ